MQKINEIKMKLTDHNDDKYITTPQFNQFTAQMFTSRLAQTNLIRKTDFDTKLMSFNGKFNSNKQNLSLLKMNLRNQKHLIQFILEAKVISKKMAHYLVFQPFYRYFKMVTGVGSGHYIYIWKYKGLSDENITPHAATN